MVISFQQYTEYHKTLVEMSGKIADTMSDVYNYAVELATKGKWKEWSDTQPEGTVFTFTEEMLCNTGDKNVDCLMALHTEMRKVCDTLTVKHFKI